MCNFSTMGKPSMCEPGETKTHPITEQDAVNELAGWLQDYLQVSPGPTTNRQLQKLIGERWDRLCTLAHRIHTHEIWQRQRDARKFKAEQDDYRRYE